MVLGRCVVIITRFVQQYQLEKNRTTNENGKLKDCEGGIVVFDAGLHSN